MCVVPGSRSARSRRSLGCADSNFSSAPQKPGPSPQTHSPSGWRSVSHASSPLPPSQSVSNPKFLSGSCKVIQLLPRASRLSPNSFGDTCAYGPRGAFRFYKAP